MKKQILSLTRGAMFAALYVLLTLLSSLFGLASGNIQVRLSEALLILIILYPEAAVGIPIGCLISNLFFGLMPWDLLFGTLATVIGCIGALALRKTGNPLLVPIPNVLANALIVPAVIILSMGGEGTWVSFPFFALTVGIGEIIACFGVGWFVYIAVKKIRR